MAVTCGFKNGSAVTYYQGVTVDEIEARVRLQAATKGVARGSWDGGGLHGRYLAGMGSLTGVVLFGADGRRAAGLYVSEDADGVEELLAFFTSELKPA